MDERARFTVVLYLRNDRPQAVYEQLREWLAAAGIAYEMTGWKLGHELLVPEKARS